MDLLAKVAPIIAKTKIYDETENMMTHTSDTMLTSNTQYTMNSIPSLYIYIHTD